MSVALRRKTVGFIAAGLVTVVLLRMLPSPGNVMHGAAALGATGWLAVCAGMAFSFLLRAWRLRVEWQHRHVLPMRGCLSVTLLHAAAVNLLPFRTGEVGYPWMLHRRWGIPVPDAAASLAWLRLQDVVVLLWLASLGACAALQVRGLLGEAPALALAMLATLAFLAVAGGSRAAALALATAGRACGRLPWPRVRVALSTVCVALAEGAQRTSSATWTCSVANALVKLTTLSVLLAALAPVPALSAWCGVLGGELSLALPLQPAAGFGNYELGAALAAAAPGGGWRAVLIPAFAVHVIALLGSLAGAMVALLLEPADATVAGQPAV